MPPWATEIPFFTVAAVLSAAVLMAGILYWRRYNRPAEKERRRRIGVNRGGRITDGVIVDFETIPAQCKQPEAALFHFTYSVAGVDYSAAQDVFTLLDRLDLPPERYIGPAQVKYQPGNGTNSIIFCEEWSGLRPANSAAGPAGVPAVHSSAW